MDKQIVYITGTDTGVGKTVLTALLLRHLRVRGELAMAMKPFCSGGRGDARLLNALQDNVMPLDRVNPFYFREPMSPWVAARRQGVKVGIKTVRQAIDWVGTRCEWLLIEGAGGLLSPLGERYAFIDLIERPSSTVFLVACNRLGVMNQVLLNCRILETSGISDYQVVLMTPMVPDLTTRINRFYLAQIIGARKLTLIPYLGKRQKSVPAIQKSHKKIKKTLAQLLGHR